MPNADTIHLILRQPNTSSSKEARRQNLKTTHTIVMLLGDNLSDFSALFDKKSYEERLQNTNRAAGEFGNTFIILPNPVYGDWEPALFQYNYKLTPAQKDSILKNWLKTY